MTQTIDYGNLMHQAMRGLIQSVLEDVAENGLPGDHHFFISFSTLHPDAELADWLADRYPDEMTVVIQHWYDNLEVSDQGFGITLNFGNAPERLFVPFDAIQTFVDPSVEFGLRFDPQDSADIEELDPDDDLSEDLPLSRSAAPEDSAADKGDAEVVSLDQFRK